MMEKEKIKRHINALEKMLEEFKEAKSRGKETNSNEVRAQSISDIEEITQRLEDYIQNNDGLLEEIAGTKIAADTEVTWDEIVRPNHFEEDLQEEINKLKEKTSN